MRISEFLTQVRQFADYIEALKAEPPRTAAGERHGDQLTVIDYQLGVFGPVPILYAYGQDHVLGLRFSPLMFVAVGWDDCHDWNKWAVRRPMPAYIQETLELSEDDYAKIDKASSLVPGYHRRLRADLIAACGLPPEENTLFFQGKSHARPPLR